MHEAKKREKQFFDSESALDTAMADFNMLTGKRTYSQAMDAYKQSPYVDAI